MTVGNFFLLIVLFVIVWFIIYYIRYKIEVKKLKSLYYRDIGDNIDKAYYVLTSFILLFVICVAGFIGYIIFKYWDYPMS